MAGAGLQGFLGLAEGGLLGVVHLLRVVLADALAQGGQIRLDPVLFLFVDLLFALGEGLVHLIGQNLGLVVELQTALPAAVLRLIGGGVRHGPLDFALGQVGGTGDGDVLFPAGAQILGRDLHHAVDVDVKGHLDLGLGGEPGPDAAQLELAQRLVVLGKAALSLQDVDFHRGLHGTGGGENLALAGGDHAVAGDEGGGDAAQGLNGQGQGGDVHQDQALRCRAGGAGQLAAALQQAALDGGAHGHALVGVEGMAGLHPQQFLHLAGHRRHSGAAAHQQDPAQIGGRQSCIPQGVVHRLDGAGQQVAGHHLKLRTGQGGVDVMGAILAHRDKGQIDLGRGGAGQLLLGLFGLLFQAAHGGGVPGQVDAVGLFELLHQPVHNPGVKVVAAQPGIAPGGQHREGAVLDLNDGHVEGAAAQVIDQNLLGSLVVQAIGHCGSGGFIDDPQDVEARNAAGVLGGLALAVVKIGWHRDDRLGDLLAQIALGVPAQLGQNHGADLLGSQVLAVDVHPVVAAHPALDAGHRPACVGGQLALGRAAHQTLSVLGKCHHRRGGALALGVGDDHRLAALYHRHTGIGGAQVDPDHFAHM